MTDRKIFVKDNPRGPVSVTRVRQHARQVLTAVKELREGEGEFRIPKPDDLEILAHDYLALTDDGSTKDAMTSTLSTTNPSRIIIPDPYPETIGASALTIFVPSDFRGDAEIIWWWPGKSEDTDRQRVSCSATALLQGVFRDVSGPRPGALFDARVVALVIHAFYRARIETAARLEAAYQWQSLANPPKL